VLKDHLLNKIEINQILDNRFRKKSKRFKLDIKLLTFKIRKEKFKLNKKIMKIYKTRIKINLIKNYLWETKLFKILTMAKMILIIMIKLKIRKILKKILMMRKKMKIMKWNFYKSITIKKIFKIWQYRIRLLAMMAKFRKHIWMVKRKLFLAMEWKGRLFQMDTQLFISIIMILNRRILIRKLCITLQKLKQHKLHILMGFKYLNFQINRSKSISLMVLKR
jgi:hypothetical protein